MTKTGQLCCALHDVFHSHLLTRVVWVFVLFPINVCCAVCFSLVDLMCMCCVLCLTQTASVASPTKAGPSSPSSKASGTGFSRPKPLGRVGRDRGPPPPIPPKPRLTVRPLQQVTWVGLPRLLHWVCLLSLASRFSSLTSRSGILLHEVMGD